MTLTELLEKKGYSIYKLSKRTGIRESTLYAIINNNTSIKNIKFDINARPIAKRFLSS